MRTFFYTVIHLPSSSRFDRSMRFDNLLSYYNAICRWNMQNPETWAYVPTGDFQPNRK